MPAIVTPPMHKQPMCQATTDCRSPPCFPAAVPDLHGPAVRLRELTEADVPAWFARATDAESADLAGDPIPASIEAGAEWLQRHRERFRQQSAIRWAITVEGAADSVGTVGLLLDPADRRAAELGIVVGRAHWRKGLATSAVQLAVGYGFDTLGLAEIRAEVLQRNAASIRLLEKTGFERLPDAAVKAAPVDDPDACFLYRRHAPSQATPHER